MSILSTLTTDTSIANEKDVVGGSREPMASGIYLSTIQTAYITTSSGGAVGLVVNFKTEEGRELRQTFWMTSGKAKGCKNYYEDRNGDKQYLPGFVMANALCLLTTGKEISGLDTEQKVISIYNPEAKAELPTTVDMLMDLVGKDVLAAIMRQTVDKTKKNDNTGLYEPTGETRDENEVDKFFRARDRMTTAEIRAKAEKAVFIDTWEQKWAGKVRDKSKGASANNGTTGLPKPAQAPSKPTNSLFA